MGLSYLREPEGETRKRVLEAGQRAIIDKEDEQELGHDVSSRDANSERTIKPANFKELYEVRHIRKVPQNKRNRPNEHCNARFSSEKGEPRTIHAKLAR